MEKHKHGRGHKKPASIDGIIQNGRTLGFPKTSSYQPSRQHQTTTLSNLQRKSDGFYPQGTAVSSRSLDLPETEEAELLDEPIVLDHLPERKHKHRHGPKHPKLRKFIKRTAFTLMILILAGAGYFGYKLYHTQKKVLAGGGRSVTVCSDNVDVSQLSKEGDSRINILLLGIGGPGHDGSDLTDTIMLASIDPITDKVSLLSIPRDLFVNIQGVGTRKLNEAYYWGKTNSKATALTGQERDGIAKLDKTLQPILDGVNINYHVLLDFSAFRQMVNALGGVTVDVPETLYDPTIAWANHGNPVIASKGVHTFDGNQALLYARSRETSSDFARGERQRLLIAAIKTKAFSLGTFSNPIKISSLLDSLGQNVYTDFSSTDMRCLYRQLSTIPSSSIESLDLVTPPHSLLTTGGATVGGSTVSIVKPLAGIGNYNDIHDFLHESLNDGLIRKENAQIAIYNATGTSGVATAESKLLKSYGYKVDTAETAPQATDPSQTVIVDLSKGEDKYTLNYLQNRFGVMAIKKVPSDFGITAPTGAKFVIILGEDVANKI